MPFHGHDFHWEVKSMQLRTILPGQQALRFASALVAFFISLAYTFRSLFSYSFAAGSLPAFFRIPRMSPVFADLRQLTHSSGCDSSFADLLANTANCDPWNRPFNYTFSSLRIFRLLGIDASSSEFAGAAIGIFGLFSALLFIFVLLRGRVLKLLISTLFLLSFPFQLAVERGNYDLAVFGLCLLVPLIIFMPNVFHCQTIKGITASALSFAVVVLKVFPFVGLAPWSLGLSMYWPERRNRWIPVLIFVLCCLGLLIQSKDLAQIMANTPKPDGGWSFGFLASYQNRLGGMIAIYFTVLKSAILIISFCMFRLDRFNGLFAVEGFDARLEASRQAALFFSWMIVVTWLVSRSFDYRMIILLGVVPFFINIFFGSSTSLRLPKVLICLSTCFLFYEQYAATGVFSVPSDVMVQPLLIGFLLSFLWRSRKKWIIPARSSTAT